MIMSRNIAGTCLGAAILTSLLGITGSAAAKDAFGLDAYKQSAEEITKPKEPYKTRFGNAINVYTVPPKTKNKDDKIVRFLIDGGLHGNELLGSEFVGWLAQRFAAGESTLNTLNGGRVEIDFVPYANPDGTILFTRYNGNHINLNRNFGVLWGVTKENPGKAAFSEVETRALHDLFEKRNYTGAVDVHGYINWVVIPTSPADKIKGKLSDDKLRLDQYEQWSKAVNREAKSQLPGYDVKTAGGLGDGGAFEDYAWWGAKVPAFCLELFDEKRFVANSIATQLVDLITPKEFTGKTPDSGRSDMFLVYERFIHNLFEEAIKIKHGDVVPVKTQIAAKP